MYDRIVPFLTSLWRADTAASVRLPCGQAYARVMRRRDLKPEQRSSMLVKIIRELFRGKACWQRLFFADFCQAMLEIFSTKFARETLIFHLCIDLMSDPVANVRIRVRPMSTTRVSREPVRPPAPKPVHPILS